MSARSRGKKTVVGVLVAGLIGLGIWLSNLFQGFGTGQGNGGPDAPSTAREDPSAREELPEDVSVSIAAASDAAIRPPDQAAGTIDSPLEMLPVLIVEEGYRIPNELGVDVSSLGSALSDHFRPAELAEVVRLAEATTGNEHGIRVLILWHRTSTSGADKRLRQALLEAGIPQTEIHRRTGYFN